MSTKNKRNKLQDIILELKDKNGEFTNKIKNKYLNYLKSKVVQDECKEIYEWINDKGKGFLKKSLLIFLILMS